MRGRSVSGAKLTALAALPSRSARLEFDLVDLVEVHTLSHGQYVCVCVCLCGRRLKKPERFAAVLGSERALLHERYLK